MICWMCEKISAIIQMSTLVTWLLQCWDKGSSILELEGSQAAVITFWVKGILIRQMERGTQVLSLWWRWFLSGMKERNPFKKDRWTTMKTSIQYLQELAMLEMFYSAPNNRQSPTDQDEILCTWPMWQTFVQNALSVYATSLAVIIWKAEAPMMDLVAHQLQQCEENLCSSLLSCILAVENLSKSGKSCSRSFSNKERIGPTRHLYRPVCQLFKWAFFCSRGRI